MSVHDQKTEAGGKEHKGLPDDLAPGTKLGEYTLVSELGRGGMGVVMKAFQESLQRYVAVKILKKDLAQNPSFITMFRQEARSAAQLRHPNIVQVYGMGEEKGMPYFVMELVPGKTLKDLVGLRAQSPVKSRRCLNVYDSLQMVLQVAQGLQFAHENGFLHRDIKPANVIQDEKTDRILLADFGLSRPLLQKDRNNLFTGGLTGTPVYMAPELFLGKQWTVSSDIYALGATMFYLLTGDMPFSAAKLQLLVKQIVSDEPPDPRDSNPEVPEEISAVVRKCMAKAPKERYFSVEEVIRDIRLFLSEGRTIACEHDSRKKPPEQLPEEVEKGMRDAALRKRAWTTALLSVVILSVFLLFSFFYFKGRFKSSHQDAGRKKIEEARNLLRAGRRDLAAPLLKEVAAKYPGSAQAREAEKMLEQDAQKP
jgi:serine/threonine protein kinase